MAWHVDAWHQAGVEAVGTRIMSLGGGLVMWGRKAPGAGGAEAQPGAAAVVPEPATPGRAGA